MNELQNIATALVTPGRGILAADESTATIGKHFAENGIENTEDQRRAYRELLFTAPGAGEFISGAILFDETIREKIADGRTLVEVLRTAGIIPGIKVDLGTEELADAPGELYTKGIEGLAGRLSEYYQLGARFAKWRAVFSISATTPSDRAIEMNADLLAEYAALCQATGIVPIVEPEVLMEGDHSIEKCLEVTQRVLTAVCAALKARGVDLPGVLLKPNMVLPGEAAGAATSETIAEHTLRCLRATVPAEVPGVVFLSGGQTEVEATAHLQAIAVAGAHDPWKLTFSFGRALQTSALAAWQGRPENVAAAQVAFIERARLVSLASVGSYAGE